jgi:hypothetical protein
MQCSDCTVTVFSYIKAYDAAYKVIVSIIQIVNNLLCHKKLPGILLTCLSPYPARRGVLRRVESFILAIYKIRFFS